MRNKIKNSNRIVIKVGTSTLTYPNGNLNLKRVDELAWILSDLRNSGKEVVLVTSGAIGVGATHIGMDYRPTIMKEKQAAAAVGQAILMQIYQNFFTRYNQNVAQALLTKEEVRTEERYDNTKNTLQTLLEMGIIPIINANDTISTYEIAISENDRLSAIVAEIISADLLVIYTDIDGLYDKNPHEHSDAHRISYVEDISDEIISMAGSKGSRFATGGMKTKIEAAMLSTSSNIPMAIIHGEKPTLIYDLLDGKDVGTFFATKQFYDKKNK